MKGKKITLAEARDIAEETARSIAARRAATNEIDGLKNRIDDLEIAYDCCGCLECFERLERERVHLERLVQIWFHITEEP